MHSSAALQLVHPSAERDLVAAEVAAVVPAGRRQPNSKVEPIISAASRTGWACQQAGR